MQGTRWFAGGAVFFVLGGVAHTMAHLQPLPDDTPTKDLMAAMTGYQREALGLSFTMEGAFNCLSWYMSTLSVLVGLSCLLLLPVIAASAWRQRMAALLHAAAAGVLTGVAVRYGIAPPIGIYGVTTALFLVAMVRTRAAKVT